MIETESLTFLAQLVAGGLAAGALYGLMALGLVLIYKTSDVVNFGHGDMAMVSTFIAFTLLRAEWPLPLALLGGLVFAALLGVVVERGVLRPARQRHAPVLTMVVITIGVAQMLNGAAGVIWGHEVQRFPPAVTGPPLRLGPAIVTWEQLFNLGVGLVIALTLYAFLKSSDLGIALRAVAQNPTAARLMGVSVNRVLALAWGIGVGLGAVAGMLAAPSIFLEPNVMLEPLIKGFAAAVLGGFTSLPGALAGGLMLGILENLVAGFIATELKTTFAFALIVAVLAVRPAGLFGRVAVKKV